MSNMIEGFLASKHSLYKIAAIEAFGNTTCKPGSSIMTLFCTTTWNGLRGAYLLNRFDYVLTCLCLAIRLAYMRVVKRLKKNKKVVRVINVFKRFV